MLCNNTTSCYYITSFCHVAERTVRVLCACDTCVPDVWHSLLLYYYNIIININIIIFRNMNNAAMIDGAYARWLRGMEWDDRFFAKLFLLTYCEYCILIVQTIWSK